MAFPDHRGQALEEELTKVQTANLEMIDRVSKLEHQLEWISMHLMTTAERDEMEAYCDI